MIIVQLKGGLGNQLFQYAAGRRLSEINRTELLLDLTYYRLAKRLPHVFFNLHCFNINAETTDMPELKQFYNNSFLGRIGRKIKTITRIGKIKRICEKKSFIFDPSFFKFPDNAFLCGYWQSEKYFKDIEEIIRKELTLKDALTRRTIAFEDKIKNMKNAVSIHIRRGDYVTNKEANNRYGLCPLDYYYNCISILKKELGSLNIVVFSDDTDWVKENFVSDNPLYFVDNNKIEYSHEDMYLMSICEHNIIANSSFSWWGAWLNNNKQKKVFAPKQWILGKKFGKLDIIPDNWIKV